jgi:hypothetical protein
MAKWTYQCSTTLTRSLMISIRHNPREVVQSQVLLPTTFLRLTKTTRSSCLKQKAVEFHNLVAKTLYATKWARTNTCTAIAFLTTRVQAPHKDDWNKLVHLMKYLRGTRTLPLILSANGASILKWWVDAAFAVHPNMQGHSGGVLFLGRGFPIVSLTKQKLKIPKALRNRKSWVPTTSCPRSVGLHTLWKPKDTKFRTMVCSRTTRAQFSW